VLSLLNCTDPWKTNLPRLNFVKVGHGVKECSQVRSGKSIGHQLPGRQKKTSKEVEGNSGKLASC